MQCNLACLYLLSLLQQRFITLRCYLSATKRIRKRDNWFRSFVLGRSRYLRYLRYLRLLRIKAFRMSDRTTRQQSRANLDPATRPGATEALQTSPVSYSLPASLQVGVEDRQQPVRRCFCSTRPDTAYRPNTACSTRQATASASSCRCSSPNLAPRLWRAFEDDPQRAHRAAERAPRPGYFPGSPSHDYDSRER